MHEAAFSQAALPAPARVLGINLKPFSLGHELWLIRENNPLAISNGRGNVSDFIAALPAAAIICSHSFSEFESLNSERFLGVSLWEMLKLKLWERRWKKKDKTNPGYIGRELAAFINYRRNGSLSFPEEQGSGGGRRMGAPILISMHQYLRREGLSDVAAWDYPYGYAQMRHAAWLESEGHLKIKNAAETEHDRAFAEWEKENAESTLTKEAANA